MRDENDAVGTETHEGTTYYGCSGECRSEFVKNPQAYVVAAAQ